MNDLPIEIRKALYHPICNKNEIERVFNVKNAKDHLLKIRADTIIDHMRLFRVYRNKALANETNWSLEKSFDSFHYESFLKYLTIENRKLCQEITFGNIFSNDPDGLIFKTDFGPIITISDSLQFFMKFSNLALLEFTSPVPGYVRMNALRIAIRVMLKTEALDFYMDPRGIVPNDVGVSMHSPVSNQLRFIAGHEFSHYILGHLSNTSVISKPIYRAISPKDHDYKSMTVYNQSQKEEFEADLKSLSLPLYNLETKSSIIEAALLWFASLELYECALNEIYPQDPWQYKSHPSARARFNNIISNANIPDTVNIDIYKRLLEVVDAYKILLIKDISNDINKYEFYGSIYLDKPDSEWRGPELKDRIDYY